MNPKTQNWILRYRGSSEDADRVLRLAEACGINPVSARLLWGRGFRTAEEVAAFLRQDGAKLYSPNLLRDMRPAVERILLAVERGERIAVYGDYDVDGVTSVTVLYLYLKNLGADVGYYIPSRVKEGYGLSMALMDILKSRGVSLMITVDTGVTAVDEIAYARTLGIETVVTDHHTCRPELPDCCAVVNPHRPDDEYPFKALAGVGVIFKTLCAVEEERCRRNGTSIEEGLRRMCADYADLVAVGTIADVMPIRDENRLLVAEGLRRIGQEPRMGLLALMNEMERSRGGTLPSAQKKRKLNSSFIGFQIAPRLNAAGRVDSASLAVELLLAETEERAAELAAGLCRLNVARQTEENRISEQALRRIEQTDALKTDKIILLADDTWKQGIVGIVSSRLTEQFFLPSILISFDGSTRGFPSGDDIGKGSGRSIPGLNLFKALESCEDLLVRFGGHEQAAGLTVRRCNIDELRRRLNEYILDHSTEEMFIPSREADCEVEMNELTVALTEEIGRMEPFGTENPTPEFVLRDATILSVSALGNGKHTKMTVQKGDLVMSAVRFGVGVAQNGAEVGDRVDLLFQLNLNEFRGETNLQLLVQDLHLSDATRTEYDADRERYREILGGATFSRDEGIFPTRDDLALVYRFLRDEYRNDRTVFPIRKLLRALDTPQIGYVKLKFLIDMMRDLHICKVTETTPDCYVFDFGFPAEKTSLENSEIYRSLSGQVR